MNQLVNATTTTQERAGNSQVGELEAKLAEVIRERDEIRDRFTRLKQSYDRLWEQVALLRRKIFAAKAERGETAGLQLQLQFVLDQVKQLESQLDQEGASNGEPNTQGAAAQNGDAAPPADEPASQDKPKRPGRRQLRELSELPEERVEIVDPELEGVAERIGFEESYRLGYLRGGHRRICLARAIYKVQETTPAAFVDTAQSVPASPDAHESCQSACCGPEAASAMSNVDVITAGESTLAGKTVTPARSLDSSTPAAAPCHDGVPASGFRSESALGVMSSLAEQACGQSKASKQSGGTSGPLPQAVKPGTASSRIITVPLPKELIRRGLLAPELISHLLISKYMMGVPFYRLEQKFELEGFSLDRGTMCRYAEDVGASLGPIVQAARDEAFKTAFCLSTDATGVLIQPAQATDHKRQACRKGHFFVILADKDHIFFEFTKSHSSAFVSDLFRGFRGYIQADASAVYDAMFRGATCEGDADGPPIEVGCWSHCRRKFWEAAVCKHTVGVDGLRLIDEMFAIDRQFAKLAPEARKLRRDRLLAPKIDAFFAWAQAQHGVILERGLVLSALGYAMRQQQPLRNFLRDGRLKMENNSSERALRPIGVGRKAWLFFGSDDHAQAAAILFSLIASCKLHRLDPEAYLTDIVRVMPYWPRDRYLELTPKYWAKTRARLVPAELARPLGPITVPPPPPTEQQPLPN